MINPDFSKVNRLVLIYPQGITEGQYNYKSLIHFYDKLISMIPEDIELLLLCKSELPVPRLEQLHKNLTYTVIEDLQTIWIRDVAGFNCGDTIVKPIFKPKYYKGAFKKTDTIDRQMEGISDFLGKKLRRMPITWDCGNLVTNGKIGIVTERVLTDNPHLHKLDITAIIQEFLRIKPIFVPEAANDPLAHVDAYMSFINEKTAVVSKYPDNWFDDDRQYVGNLKSLLIEQDIEVIDVCDNPEDKFYCGIPSAKGVFVNFIQINNHFLLPEYKFDTAHSSQDYNLEAKKVLRTFGKVLPINSDDLSKYGGVLHSISFCD